MIHLSLVVAAILTFGIGVVHSWLGEVRLIGPLTAPGKRQGLLDKSAFARQVLRFAWHLTTLAWWGIAAILALLAMSTIEGEIPTILTIIAVTFFVTGLVTLVSSCGRHLAWLVFFAIAGLSILPLY